jgi:3-hydroxybutyryl-CoA dehydratase
MNPATHAFIECKPGHHASITRTVQESDIIAFAAITGDTNPVHLDEAFARTTRFGKRIAHGMLTASYISAVLGTKLPGPGAIYLEQNTKFVAPVAIGDTITTTVKVRSLNEKGVMILDCECVNQHRTLVITGQATVVYKHPAAASATTAHAATGPARSATTSSAGVWPPAGVTPLKQKGGQLNKRRAV